MIRKKYIAVLSICSTPFLLGGCSLLGLATGAAAVTGISAAAEGGIPRAISDTKIKLQINEAWFRYNVDAFTKLSTTVNQRRVLLTGVVQDPRHRVEAVRLVWLVPGVTQVLNEIRVANSKGVTGYVKDSWISSRLRGSLTLDRSVQSINYSIETVQGVVYLMGVAQHQAELNRAVETARTISGVKQVVSYVKLAGQPLEGQQNAQAIAGTTVAAQPQTIRMQPNHNGVTYNQPAQLQRQPQLQPANNGVVYNQQAPVQRPVLRQPATNKIVLQPIPQYQPPQYEPPQYQPVQNYGPIVTEGEGQYYDQGLEVPAVRVSPTAQQIEDKYYR